MNLKLQVEQLSDCKKKAEELPEVKQELCDVKLEAEEIPVLREQVGISSVLCIVM